MSVNSSSSNDSLPHPNSSSISHHFETYCLLTRPSSLIFTAYSITQILLLLPLCILILHLGLQRWKQQRSTSTAATKSHSDCFTFHMVTMELIGVFGCIICCCGVHKDDYNILFAGSCLWSFMYYGEMFFLILTCVEHYLAVIHPVTYLSLRRERGIRIRNISIGCVWVLCFGATSLMFFENVPLIFDFCLLIFFLIITSFCSLSVLYVLIRPGPGKQGADRERVDQSKQRALYTIMAIWGVLLLRFFWHLTWAFLYLLTQSRGCVAMAFGVWFNLPSSLVLPLLFLHRAEMLVCCKKQH